MLLSNGERKFPDNGRKVTYEARKWLVYMTLNQEN